LEILLGGSDAGSESLSESQRKAAFLYGGDVDHDAAVRCGGVVVEGPRELARALPRWFMWSPMAHLIRTHRESSRPRTVKLGVAPPTGRMTLSGNWVLVRPPPHRKLSTNLNLLVCFVKTGINSQETMWKEYLQDLDEDPAPCRQPRVGGHAADSDPRAQQIEWQEIFPYVAALDGAR
jgi:hypothetical protein